MVRNSSEILVTFIEMWVLQTPAYDIGTFLFCHICPKPIWKLKKFKEVLEILGM